MALPAFAPGHGGPAKPPPKAPAPAATGGINPNNPLLNPGQPLSGAALYQAAQALAQAQTGPSITALQQQIAQQQRQTTGAENLTGGYFNQLGQLGQNAADRASTIGSNLNSQLAQIAGDENSQLQGLGQNAQSMLSKYAPEGATAAPSLASEIARMQGLAAQQEGTNRAFGATQGANYGSLAASQIGTGALKGQEDLSQIAQAGQLKNLPLTQKIAALQAQTGALTASNAAKLRQQEITNAITEQGLGIKQQDLQLQRQLQQFNTNPNAPGSPAYGRVQGAQTAAKNAGTNAAKAQQQAQQQAWASNPKAVGSPAWERVQNVNTKGWDQNPNAVGSPAWARVQTANARSGGGAKPLSTQENNTWFGKLGTVAQLIRDAQKQSVNGQPPTNQQIVDALTTGNNPAKVKFDAFQVRVAMELLGYGSVDQSTAAIMHNQYGLRGGTFNGQPIKVTPDYKPPPPVQIPNAGGTLNSGVGAGFGG